MPVVVKKKKVDAAQSNTDTKDVPGAVIMFPAAMAKAASPPPFSDEALALRFAELHAGDLRYVAALNMWYHYDGKRWQQDQTLKSVDLVREVCRAAAAECGNGPVGTKLASSATVYAVQRLARSDSRLAATVAQWDAEPWLLNTPETLIDLRTGKSRPRNPGDYCTKMTAVSPGGECPRWHQFLSTIFAGNVDTIDYVQRVAGYALTGSTKEQAMFFCYGTGANGKGTLLNTLDAIMGGYSATASMETFTASPYDRHPAELAVLLGARMVTASETEEGRRWAEARIKSITGGDPLTVRFMKRDPFTYTPQFKLVMAGNHKPGLGGVDEAIRRRLHLIPFGYTIPEKERDKDFSEKLQAEWPGILAWAIDGCLKWQCQTLNAPAAVIQATTSYLEAEDALGQWLEECCDRDPGYWEGSSALFPSWRAWAEGRGETAGSQRRFTQALESRGFETKRKTKARGFAGLRLKANIKQMVALDMLQEAGVTLVTPEKVNQKNTSDNSSNAQ